MYCVGGKANENGHICFIWSLSTNTIGRQKWTIQVESRYSKGFCEWQPASRKWPHDLVQQMRLVVIAEDSVAHHFANQSTRINDPWRRRIPIRALGPACMLVWWRNSTSLYVNLWSFGSKSGYLVSTGICAFSRRPPTRISVTVRADSADSDRNCVSLWKSALRTLPFLKHSISFQYVWWWNVRWCSLNSWDPISYKAI